MITDRQRETLKPVFERYELQSRTQGVQLLTYNDVIKVQKVREELGQDLSVTANCDPCINAFVKQAYEEWGLK